MNITGRQKPTKTKEARIGGAGQSDVFLVTRLSESIVITCYDSFARHNIRERPGDRSYAKLDMSIDEAQRLAIQLQMAIAGFEPSDCVDVEGHCGVGTWGLAPAKKST